MKTEEVKAKERAYEIIASLATNGHLDSSITAEKATILLADALKQYKEETDKYAISLTFKKDEIIANQSFSSITPVLEIVNAVSVEDALGKTMIKAWKTKENGATINTFVTKKIED